MKKLMMAAAIVCAAAFAQAGAVSWGALTIPAGPQGIVASTTTYSAYLFQGTDITAATKLLDGTAKGFEDFVALAKDSRTKTATSKGVISFTNATASGLDYANESVSMYMIILDAAAAKDAKNYLVAKDSEGNNVLTRVYGATGSNTFGWGNQTSSGATWTAVAPEPTSGLLLLIGMAGLALRRRRA